MQQALIPGDERRHGGRTWLLAAAFVGTLALGLHAGPTQAQTNPAIQAQPAVTRECASFAGTSVTVTAQVTDTSSVPYTVTATVDNRAATVTPSSGSSSQSVSVTETFADGSHTVTFNLGDGSTSSTTVKVVDTTPPVVTCSVTRAMLWPPNHNLINVGFTYSVQDVCDPSPTVTEEVYSNEADVPAGTGDDHFSPDAKPGPDQIAPGTLRLRSERLGHGDGRVYLIVVTATDASGNKGSCCSTVVVPHDMSRRSIASVLSQAAAAQTLCDSTNGGVPSGFVLVGVGPTIGPKQ